MDNLNDRKSRLFEQAQYEQITRNNPISLLKIEYGIEDDIRQQILRSNDTNKKLDPSAIQEGHLSQRDQQYFLSLVNDKVAYFKGSFYANDQFKEEELQFQFSISSKFDGFNISRSADFQSILDTNDKPSLIPG